MRCTAGKKASLTYTLYLLLIYVPLVLLQQGIQRRDSGRNRPVPILSKNKKRQGFFNLLICKAVIAQFVIRSPTLETLQFLVITISLSYRNFQMTNILAENCRNCKKVYVTSYINIMVT